MAPYKSQAQQGFFHSPAAEKAGISPSTVKEFDKASKGEHDLPEHVAKKKKKKQRRQGGRMWVEQSDTE